jgi:hypothetical protein
MEHFSTQKWIDFVRGTAESSLVTAIQQHLAKKCSECSKNEKTWRHLMEATKKLNNLEPPTAALQAVKASFGLRKVVTFPSGKLDLAVLQFDSELQPLAAGMRSGPGSARQLLYKSGSVCIDMRMQPTPGSESILLIGQLLDSLNPGHGIGGIPVSLLAKGDTLSRKQTNDAGEFDFGVKPMHEMQLVFGIGESRTIVVSVPQATYSGRVM